MCTSSLPEHLYSWTYTIEKEAEPLLRILLPDLNSVLHPDVRTPVGILSPQLTLVLSHPWLVHVRTNRAVFFLISVNATNTHSAPQVGLLWFSSILLLTPSSSSPWPCPLSPLTRYVIEYTFIHWNNLFLGILSSRARADQSLSPSPLPKERWKLTLCRFEGRG